jgi:hypothetical protein
MCVVCESERNVREVERCESEIINVSELER